MRVRAWILFSALGLGSVAWGQADPAAQARRLLEDAREYLRDGRHKQAFDNLQTIVNGFAQTDSVDDALLEIGRYHAEVEGDPEAARTAFAQLVQRFPQSDGAPGAYYFLGRLRLDNARTAEDLDDALAQFDRLQSLYPRSAWVAAALHATGLVHRRAGRLQESLAAQRRASLEYPASEVAAEAQFQIGHVLALLGEPGKALEEFQRVRNRFPDSPVAVRALDRSTALLRLHGVDGPRFRRDPSWSLPAGDVLRDVRAVLDGPGGNLWLASDKVGAAVPFDAEGRMGASLRGDDLRTLSLNVDGAVTLTTRYGVRWGSDIMNFPYAERSGQPAEPLDKILAAAQLASGEWLVSDENLEGVHRFDAAGKHLGAFPDAAKRQVTRIVVDGEGDVVWLDERARAVEVLDRQGRRRGQVAPRGSGYELERPRDVAVDPFRNLYVADEKAGVLVFGSDGKLLARFGQGELDKPTALALRKDGSVLVYDEKDRQLVRYH